jgi:hypothetical protein
VPSTFAAVAALCVLLWGCGEAHPSGIQRGARSRSVCTAAASATLARAAGVPVASVQAVAATGNNAQPECRLSAGRLQAVVNVDASPQPYQRLERTIVEDGQQFGAVRNFSPPVAVGGVGLDAAWLPDQNRLITADRSRLVSVTLDWPAASPSRRRAVAGLLARSSLAR